MNLEFYKNSYLKDNYQPIFESNIPHREDSNADSNNPIRQSETKLFSNQNLYYTNFNQANKVTEDFIFEKPYDINQAKNNHVKFSNTQIPEVFDEVYIQRRINKAEINSPNGELAEKARAKDNCNSNQSFNPIVEMNRSKSRRVSSNNSNLNNKSI